MESTYRPQSPDLSSYAPQSPDLSGYRPQSPDLSAPLPSPRFGGFNPHQQQQRQQYHSGQANGFGGHALGYQPTSIPQQPAYGQQPIPQQYQHSQSYDMPVSTRRMNMSMKQEETNGESHMPDHSLAQQQSQPRHVKQEIPPPQPLHSFPAHGHLQQQQQSHYLPPPQQPPIHQPQQLQHPPPELHTELSAPLQKMQTSNLKSHIKSEGASSNTDATLGVDLKTSFPVARIKRIMQADEDIGKVAQVTPHVVSRALELFMIKLVSGAATQAKGPGGAGGGKGGKRVLAQHMKKAVQVDRDFDFLDGIMEKVPDAPAGKAKKEVGSDSEEGKPKKRSRKRKDSEDEA